MKIGVSSYSFKKYITETECDYFHICDKAKEIGFDGIEFVNLENYTKRTDLIELAGEIREHCNKIGLEIVAYTIGANFLAEDIEAEIKRVCSCVDIAKALGAPLMRHDVCYSLPQKHTYSYRDAIKDMTPHIRRVTEYAKSLGIKTCTENHGSIFQKPERVEELILSVDNENYGWLCDIGNFLCADADPITSVGIAAPYAFHVHAKDFLFKSGELTVPKGFSLTTVGGNLLRGTVVGHGCVPVKSCLAALKKVGYDGYVSIEFEGMEECIPAIVSGFEYLKSII